MFYTKPLKLSNLWHSWDTRELCQKKNPINKYIFPVNNNCIVVLTIYSYKCAWSNYDALGKKHNAFRTGWGTAELEQLASWVLSKQNDVFEHEMNCNY